MADFEDLLGDGEKALAKLKAEKEYVKVQKQLLENLGLIAQAQENVVAAELKRKARQAELTKLQEEYAANLLKVEKFERDLAEAIREGNKAKQISIEIEIALANAYNSSMSAKLKTAETDRRIAETMELVNKAAEGSTKNIITMTTGIKDMVNSSSGFDQILVRFASGEIGAEQMAAGFDTAIKSVTDMFSQVNLMANGLKVLYEIMFINILAAKEIDSAIVNFNKTIGSPGGFNDLLSDAADDLMGFGISARDAIQNIETLVGTVRGFADLSIGAQKEVAQFVSLLDKMGFSAEAQAKNIVFLNKSFGLSEKAAAKFNTRLVSISKSLDMPIGDITQGFQDAQRVLGASAQTSEELAEQFGQLAAQADATNLSIGKLVDITQKFDTFDTAAQQVGKLNAMLGGPFLSTVEMVGATNPAERIEMLADSLDRAGKSFDDMSYFERKAIADAAGLQDVNDLALLMSGNLNDITGPDLSQAEIVELQQQMKDFNDIVQSGKNLMMSTVVSMAPMVDTLKDVMLDLEPIFAGIGLIVSTIMVPAFQLIAGVVRGLSLPFKIIKMVLDEISLKMEEFNISTEFLSNTLPMILDAFTGIGVVFGTLLIPMMIKFIALQTVAFAKLIGNMAMSLAGHVMDLFTVMITYFFPMTGPLGIAIASGLLTGIVGAIGAVGGMAAGLLPTADDFMSPGEGSEGYGKRVILGPEGAFALNNKDTVVAGTNLTQNTVNNNNTTTQTAAPAAATPTGPINMNVVLSIDGSEIRTVVNSVKVDPTLNSNLYNSIAKLITSGDEAR